MGIDLGLLPVGKLELGLELASEMQRVDPITGFDTDFNTDFNTTAGSEAVVEITRRVVIYAQHRID
jgi:hypothetical protein